MTTSITPMLTKLAVRWPAPDNIVAFTTYRMGGVSEQPYDTLNLGLHVGDTVPAVTRNRQLLLDSCQGLNSIQWLSQVHGNTVISASATEADPDTDSPASANQIAVGNTDSGLSEGLSGTGTDLRNSGLSGGLSGTGTDLRMTGAGSVARTRMPPEADACFTRQVGLGCAVMTADCLPVFICDNKGEQVAVAHAGWRGLLAGIIENTVTQFSSGTGNLLVWLGPAISQQHFEVGQSVRQAFVHASSTAMVKETERAFQASEREQHYVADLYQLARIRLKALGIRHIYGGERCCYGEPHYFFSYRRDGTTGRMVNLIYKRAH